MARIRKPFFSNCSIMSPMAFLATASGLTMVKVRCRVFMISLFILGSFDGCLPFGMSQARPSLGPRSSAHSRHHSLTDVRRRFGHANPSSFHGFDFLGGSTLATGNDGASVAHSASRRSRLPGDESHHWLLHPSLYVLSSSFFRVATDFPDHHHHFG